MDARLWGEERDDGHSTTSHGGYYQPRCIHYACVHDLHHILIMYFPLADASPQAKKRKVYMSIYVCMLPLTL